MTIEEATKQYVEARQAYNNICKQLDAALGLYNELGKKSTQLRSAYHRQRGRHPERYRAEDNLRNAIDGK